VQLVKRIADRAGKDSPAAAYLAAGLELAGVSVAVTDAAAKQRLLSEFRSNEVASKPIGFYTWSEQLSTLFRFLRFFQREFGEQDAKDLLIPQALASILAQDKGLLAEYEQALAFYARLTNPRVCLSLADVQGAKPLDGKALQRLASEKHVGRSPLPSFHRARRRKWSCSKNCSQWVCRRTSI